MHIKQREILPPCKKRERRRSGATSSECAAAGRQKIRCDCALKFGIGMRRLLTATPGKITNILRRIEKRGNAYWIRASVGYRVDGRQVQPSRTWAPELGMTEKQIEKELQRQAVLFDEACSAASSFDGHVKFVTFVEQYLNESAEADLRHKTTDGCRSLKPRVVKALGHLYLDRIGPRDIKKFLNQLAKPEQNQRDGGSLCAKSIKNYRVFLSSVFSYAVDMELISENPCRKGSDPSGPKARKDWYTLEKAQTPLDSLLTNAPLKYQASSSWQYFAATAGRSYADSSGIVSR